jgi:hypothetical protein
LLEVAPLDGGCTARQVQGHPITTVRAPAVSGAATGGALSACSDADAGWWERPARGGCASEKPARARREAAIGIVLRAYFGTGDRPAARLGEPASFPVG